MLNVYIHTHIVWCDTRATANANGASLLFKPHFVTHELCQEYDKIAAHKQGK